jgi:hypothetical protein
VALLVLGAPLRVRAQTDAPVDTTGPVPEPRSAMCLMIETAARANALPVDFFARVIWQESRFQPDVIGPVTRSGERALGIAQFMPGTAAERHLVAPFDPVEALPKSGEFLAELRDEFGNLGLAAAAYNAGPQRVHDFLAGARDLPAETRNYVLAITGRSVEDWATPVKEVANKENSGGQQADQSRVSCEDLVALLERTPNPSAAVWPGHNVPSWCRGLRHPDINLCGPVHLIEPLIRTASAVISRSHVHLSRSSLR